MLLGLEAFEIGGDSLRGTNYLDWNNLLSIGSIKDSASLVMYINKLIISTWLWLWDGEWTQETMLNHNQPSRGSASIHPPLGVRQA